VNIHIKSGGRIVALWLRWRTSIRLSVIRCYVKKLRFVSCFIRIYDDDDDDDDRNGRHVMGTPINIARRYLVDRTGL